MFTEMVKSITQPAPIFTLFVRFTPMTLPFCRLEACYLDAVFQPPPVYTVHNACSHPYNILLSIFVPASLLHRNFSSDKQYTICKLSSFQSSENVDNPESEKNTCSPESVKPVFVPAHFRVEFTLFLWNLSNSIRNVSLRCFVGFCLKRIVHFFGSDAYFVAPLITKHFNYDSRFIRCLMVSNGLEKLRCHEQIFVLV